MITAQTVQLTATTWEKISSRPEQFLESIYHRINLCVEKAGLAFNALNLIALDNGGYFFCPSDSCLDERIRRDRYNGIVLIDIFDQMKLKREFSHEAAGLIMSYLTLSRYRKLLVEGCEFAEAQTVDENLCLLSAYIAQHNEQYEINQYINIG